MADSEGRATDEPAFCRGCGRPLDACGGSCQRGGPGFPDRFCTRCGWRLRTIASVPGLTVLWCRLHGSPGEAQP